MMLRLRPVQPVCNLCHLRSLRLFEAAFPVHARQASRWAPRSSSVRRNPQRQFSRLRPRLDVHGANTIDDAEKKSPSRSVVEDGGNTTQAAVVEMLERELGTSLDEAINNDKAAVEALVQRLSNEFTVTLEAAGDPLQTMRNNGATQTEIVREARNIFGDSLPEEVLNADEFVQYRRLYGEPSPEIDGELESFEDEIELDPSSIPPHALYSADGEQIVYEVGEERPDDKILEYRQNSNTQDDVKVARSMSPDLPADREDLTVQQIADSVGGELVTNESEDIDDEDVDHDHENSNARSHLLTTLGRFGTTPKTVFLPSEEFVRPVEKLMSGFSNKHLKEMCERTFGGPGLPDSPLTPRSGRFKQQVPIPLTAGQSVMGEMEANAFVTSIMPPTYASILSVLAETRKRLGASWLTRLLAREGGPRVLDVSSGGAGIIAWREMVKAHWDAIHSSDRNPPPVPATKSVVLTGSDALRHRAADMLENTTFIPRLPDYVHTRDTPTLEDDRPAQSRKQFDVIIAPHSLFPLKEEWMRKQHVQNLWSMLSNESGVLILIEKGMPRGFEALAGAREMLLERHIASPPGHQTHYSKTLDEESIHKKETAMIVAPCTNHERCPMYTIPGLSKGRKDICSFQQRYIRPPFLQRILGASDRNHDDVDFSYLSIMKGDDLRTRHLQHWAHLENPSSAPSVSDLVQTTEPYSTLLDKAKSGFEGVLPSSNAISNDSTGAGRQTYLQGTHQLPRAILPPIKRKGHVSLDLCTPAGSIERWTVPRSFSKQAYHDARKSRWGDLWALGAKTRTARNLSLGVPEKDLVSKKKKAENTPMGTSRGAKQKVESMAQQMLDARERDRLAEVEDQEDLMRELDEEFEIDAGVPNDSFDPAPTKRGRGSARARKGEEPTSRHRIQMTTRAVGTNMSEDEISQALADWQNDFDTAGLSGRKQTRRLNKLDKKKIRKEMRAERRERSVYRGDF